MTNLFDLTGRVAVVTGASIVAVGRSSMEETGAMVRDAGGALHAISADLSSTAPVAGIVDEAIRTFGAIDILVNNAGIVRRADSVDFTEEDWDAVINVNLKTLFFLTQAAGATART